MILLIERYLMRLMISRFLIILLGMTFLVIFLDLLSSADNIIVGASDEAAAITRYMMLRAPLIISQLMPFVALLSALVVLTRLVRFSELVAVRAAGISQFRVMRALLPVAILIAAPQFALDNLVVPKALTELRLWGVGDYQVAQVKDATWLRDGRNVLRVGSFDQSLNLMRDVSIFQRDEKGELLSMTTAEQAQFDQGGWTLSQVVISDPRSTAPERLATMQWETEVGPEIFDSFSQHPRELPLQELVHFVSNPAYGNQPQYLYEVWFHKRLALPIATIVIVLICVPLVQRFERSAGPLIMILSGIGIGFLYLAFDSVILSIGEAGLLPAYLAAWIPTAAAAAVGASIAFHFELHR